MGLYLADSMSGYYDCEPESTLVAEAEGRVVAALLGTVDSRCYDVYERRHVRPLLFRRTLLGHYGWPAWLWPNLRTDLANRRMAPPPVDPQHYPAELHIGVLPAWRRLGIGTALMARFAAYLRERGVPGYHLYASSFHPLGVTFYRKLGLTLLGQFAWRFHTGEGWLDVTKLIFGKAT